MLAAILTIRTADTDRFVRGILLKSMVLISAIGLITIFFMVDPNSPMRQTINAGIFAMLACLPVVFALAHYGKIHSGSLVLAIPLLLVIFFAVPRTEVLDKPSTMLLLIPTLIVGITIHSRAAAIFAACTVALAVALMGIGYIPSVRGTNLAVIYLVATLLFIWLLIYTLERGRNEARKQSEAAQQRQMMLAEREQELQHSNDDMQLKNAELERALALVQQLEMPIIPIGHSAVIVPLVGHIDMPRAEKIQANILRSVYQQRANHVIIDLTGATEIDPEVSDHLLKIIHTIALLGAHVMLTGISSTMAMALVEKDIRLDGIWTSGNLADAIHYVIEHSVS